MTTTKDEIIWQNEVLEMAKEAGARQMVSSLTHPNGPVTALKFDLDSKSIEAFAKLVAAKERADEREACAVIAEESFCGCARGCCSVADSRANEIANAIRARGEA